MSECIHSLTALSYALMFNRFKITNMNERDFIKREKETGYLKGRKKLNTSDIHFLLRKYANEYHESKVKHLCIGDVSESYINGVEDTCNAFIERTERLIKEQKEQEDEYACYSRARKKNIEAMEKIIYKLADVKLIILSYMKENVFRKRVNNSR